MAPTVDPAIDHPEKHAMTPPTAKDASLLSPALAANFTANTAKPGRGSTGDDDIGQKRNMRLTPLLGTMVPGGESGRGTEEGEDDGRHHSSRDELPGKGEEGNGGDEADCFDDGEPSESVKTDLLRCLRLIRDERHLVAYDIYRNARNRAELLNRRFKLSEGAGVEEMAAECGDDSGPPRENSFKTLLRAHSPRKTKSVRDKKSGEGYHATGRPSIEEERQRLDISEARVLLDHYMEEFEQLEVREKLKKIQFYHSRLIQKPYMRAISLLLEIYNLLSVKPWGR